jgi:hypothetical protein
VHIALTTALRQTGAAESIDQGSATVKSTVGNRLEGELIKVVKGGATISGASAPKMPTDEEHVHEKC